MSPNRPRQLCTGQLFLNEKVEIISKSNNKKKSIFEYNIDKLENTGFVLESKIKDEIFSLIKFCNKNIGTSISEQPQTVEVTSKEIYNYPIVFLTGHGNVFFSEEAIQNLRNYLISGGFLQISDNYGLDKYIRPAMQKVFPDLEFQEIPGDHPIFHQKYNFNTLPKIHEHNNKPAQGLGLFYEGRLICFYDYETKMHRASEL